jgi:hypothetical protein
MLLPPEKESVGVVPESHFFDAGRLSATSYVFESWR